MRDVDERAKTSNRGTVIIPKFPRVFSASVSVSRGHEERAITCIILHASLIDTRSCLRLPKDSTNFPLMTETPPMKSFNKQIGSEASCSLALF